MRPALLALTLLAPAAGLAAAPRPAQHRVFLSSWQQRDALASGMLAPPKSLLDVGAPMTYGDYRWDDRGVPRGPTWVRVDLQSQMLSVFRAGHEIGTAVILYGTDGYPTPTGRFPVLAKFRNHVSRTYDNAPMPFTLRLRNDGVSIHGTNVRYGFASHGCVGVPTPFAAKLFNAVSTGDPVLIVGAPKRRSAKT